MFRILLILIALPVGDVVWWWRADRRLRSLPRAAFWRTLLALFIAPQLGYLFSFIVAPRWARQAHLLTPTPLLAITYIWHLLVMPVLLLVGTPAMLWGAFRRSNPPKHDPDRADHLPTRRYVLATSVAAVPPLVATGIAAASLVQLNHFRIRRFTLPLPQLPPELDGLTIAHVSDVHVGRFTRPGHLPAIADATNNLRADLVLMSGDLIDLSLTDLPSALDFVRRLDPRHGLLMCEGNHDLIDNPDEFEQRVKASGVPLLVDESAILNLRGVALQILGLRWGGPADTGARRSGSSDASIAAAMTNVLAQRQPGTFPILMAHHPHAFDSAADACLPLTLAGHTHGGQLMLTDHLGFGPVMFRYWSGLYRKENSHLIVSNGVGNWFPVRTHAPAEIVHLTLRNTV